MSFAASTIWEARSTGSNSNGGGFDASLGGTDYSQQDAAQVTGTVTSSGTTVTATTSIFTAAMVGNYITDGTTWKEITAYTSGLIVTVDSAPSWTAASIAVGGALATLSQVALLVVAGNSVYAKNSASFSELLSLSTSGAVNSIIQWIGYNTVRGDGGRAIIEGGNTRATCLQLNAITKNVFTNFTFQGATTQVLAWTGSTQIDFFNCRILKGTGTAPVSMQPTSGSAFPALGFTGCEIANFASHGIRNCTPAVIDRCDIHGNGGSGIVIRSYISIGSITGNAIYGNTSQGVDIPGSSQCPNISGNSINNNGGDGIKIAGSNNGRISILDNVIENNAGKNINIVSAPTGTTIIYAAKNFFYAGNGNYSNASYVVSVVADVQLTADAFTSSTNLTLNSAAGGGALVKAARAFQVFPSGNFIGYASGGAVEQQASGGGTSYYPSGKTTVMYDEEIQII